MPPEVGKMNRAFLIIFVPAILVALGYVLVFRLLGLSPGYLKFVLGGVVFLAAAYWLWPKRGRGAQKA
jgi:ABC-type spermidine/putrescine transport system permease subunit II